MGNFILIDTFDAFRAFWSPARDLPLEEQIDGWARHYLAAWPELRQKQIDNYRQEGINWRQVAGERVFPFISAWLPAMQEAHAALPRACRDASRAAADKLGFDTPVSFVIYVGIGCGAGWATTYNGTPAVLLGLEKIAELGWTAETTLRGLVAHEVGHLVHVNWRARAGEKTEKGPLWDIYEEGFAQHCEQIITGSRTPHMAVIADGPQWLRWCRDNRTFLAREYLRRCDAGLDIRDFFGDWFDIQGRKQCGYFLGSEVIWVLRQQMSLKSCAALDDFAGPVREALNLLGSGHLTQWFSSWPKEWLDVLGSLGDTDLRPPDQEGSDKDLPRQPL